MRSLLGFALAAMAVVGLGAGVGALFLGPRASESLWWAAGLAYGVQLVAFAALVATRDRGAMFWAAWGGGMLLRLGLVAFAGLWLVRAAALDPAVLLLGLAGFLFILLLLEPVFLRVERR